MKRLIITVALCTSGLSLRAENANERLEEATQIFKEIMATPEKGIPQDLLEKAHCIVIVPSLKQAALGIGGKYGRGFAICRRNQAGWGAPAAVRVEGGSVGFQIGASSTDAIMLIMNERGMRRLLEDKFTMGAQASVAAGPVGRSVSAQTDAQLSADILSWSRARGLFAGIALEGATMRNDLDENEELYGSKLHNKEILLTERKPPGSATPLLAMLNQYSRHESPNKPLETRAQEEITGDADRAKPKTDTKP
jgi:lipid-binding SYLF domain-containing protein